MKIEGNRGRKLWFWLLRRSLFENYKDCISEHQLTARKRSNKKFLCQGFFEGEQQSKSKCWDKCQYLCWTPTLEKLVGAFRKQIKSRVYKLCFCKILFPCPGSLEISQHLAPQSPGDSSQKWCHTKMVSGDWGAVKGKKITISKTEGEVF